MIELSIITNWIETWRENKKH